MPHTLHIFSTFPVFNVIKTRYIFTIQKLFDEGSYLWPQQYLAVTSHYCTNLTNTLVVTKHTFKTCAISVD